MAIEDSTPAPPASPELPISGNDPQQETFAPRRVTVSYIGPSTPYLRLRGHWLDRAGFHVGTSVRIEVSERRLIVEATEPEEPPRCSEPDCPHETKNKRRRRKEYRQRE
jgi:hypothetical protein